jgi:hypothetical protein
MPKADLASRKRHLGLRKRRHLPRHLDMLRSRRASEIALPAQPGLSTKGTRWRKTLVLVEVMQPPAGLGIKTAAYTSQAFDVIAKRRRRKRTKILGTEQIEDPIQLSDELLRGPIPPLPTLRTHVRIISNSRRMSRLYLQETTRRNFTRHKHQTTPLTPCPLQTPSSRPVPRARLDSNRPNTPNSLFTARPFTRAVTPTPNNPPRPNGRRSIRSASAEKLNRAPVRH